MKSDLKFPFSNPVDLLRFEHAVLRVRFSAALRALNCDVGWQILEETHGFIVGWHAPIEDNYVFQLFPAEATRPFTNDHLLIRNYGDGVLRERRRDWAERYVKVVLDHNANEEERLFVLPIDEGRTVEVTRRVVLKLKEFPRYGELTGVRL
ncbi:hypothetical protein HS1genome_1819 [Sulfodiicoccus acidiphilus]|uniref:Hemerythrin-like domain-containing protein n=1 Tax=Sulfodiicoccus acidiphilus TaxID=1670455 RepID=A0A348B5H8_9CREN|nr:hemerythrin domain-containing protein [Sulfodiicoccus acidiphilus]BBD73430.1 hypothetical protein HS1genome_1819 [Sulfodiicoccus acidiphilus]GGT98592.1 hypothetical protein GCM10007116_15000 [Sulfodiicoccus acidiphilus]